MSAWEDEFGRTWLADPGRVQDFDLHCRHLLARHRHLKAATHPDVAATSVLVLARDVGRFGTQSDWFWCSVALYLLAELLFGAQVGRTLGAGQSGWSEDLRSDLEPLILLRNCLLHPAHQSSVAGSDRPHVPRLVEWLHRNGWDDLARPLERSWAFLGHRRISEFALRKVDSAGRTYGRGSFPLTPRQRA